jgi:acetyl-CoA carboxylase carboxyltransferase component
MNVVALQVLKFGAQIVDALVAYEQPLFVYIPPYAGSPPLLSSNTRLQHLTELRGGAWVVVDSTINKDVMEFYCANNARGGVLEPNGAASIKFRGKDLKDTAHRYDCSLACTSILLHRTRRLDPQLQKMVHELKGSSDADRDTLNQRIAEREQQLLGVYEQIAVHFADLHDTPGRMCAKGVCRKMVPI